LSKICQTMIVRLTKFQEYNFHEQLNCHETQRTINSCIFENC